MGFSDIEHFKKLINSSSIRRAIVGLILEKEYNIQDLCNTLKSLFKRKISYGGVWKQVKILEAEGLVLLREEYATKGKKVIVEAKPTSKPMLWGKATITWADMSKRTRFQYELLTVLSKSKKPMKIEEIAKAMDEDYAYIEILIKEFVLEDKPSLDMMDLTFSISDIGQNLIKKPKKGPTLSTK